jgi:ABC-type nitrate/sulfonate/bicarbonate transport system ATPase subunit
VEGSVTDGATTVGALVEPPRTTASLELRGVSQSFSTKTGELLVIDDIDITVGTNEFVTLLGPSGCGKSTLFNIISGLLQPTTGSVHVDGVDVTGQTGHVGYMFQKDLLLPWRTVLKNLLLGPQVQRRSRRQAEEEARGILARLGLGDFEHHYPAQLSGGMRQRVAFGRTLLFHKDLLLLDEPLGALDSQTRETMQEWLLEVWSEFKKTVLLVSHDIDESIFLSDRIYVLGAKPGRVVAQLDVPLPRPRTAETRLLDEFAHLRQDVYRLLRSEVGA